MKSPPGCFTSSTVIGKKAVVEKNVAMKNRAR
jgi:hypothetical protein